MFDRYGSGDQMNLCHHCSAPAVRQSSHARPCQWPPQTSQVLDQGYAWDTKSGVQPPQSQRSAKTNEWPIMCVGPCKVLPRLPLHPNGSRCQPTAHYDQRPGASQEHIMRGCQLRRQRHQCFMMGEQWINSRAASASPFNHQILCPANVAQQSEITCKVAIQIV
jgi:hypothetical protein